LIPDLEMKPLHYVLIGLFCGLIASAFIVLLNLPSRGVPIELITNNQKNTAALIQNLDQITVHIDGQVNKPGLYNLPSGSRINDAIVLAGGLTENANLQLLNLASIIEDGQKIYILSSDEIAPTDSFTTKSGQISNSVNINLANIEELVSLPGIGTTKAQAIIDYRNQHGPFMDKKDILLVPGIGDVIFDNIFNLITIGP